MYKQIIRKLSLLATNASIKVGALCMILLIVPFYTVVAAGGFPEMINNFKLTAGQFFANTTDKDPNVFTAYNVVVNTFVGVMGVVFLTNIIIAGCKWMNSGGEAEAIKKVQSKIINNILGIIIILAAYAITYFVIEPLIGATVKI